MDVHRQSLARYRLGSVLDTIDICCVTAERSSLRMVYFDGDAYWVSRRLNNIASSHAGVLWIVNLCKESTCNIAANDTGQDDCPAML